MNIRILDDAQKDLEKSAEFYESQALGLGIYFIDALLADIESLKLVAGVHLKVNVYFRLLSKFFPYAIYYLMDDEHIDVYAVLDCREHPDKTKNRLK